MTDFAESYGPWAVVAGASDGIGAAFAEGLAARGLNVVLVARRQPLLEEVASRLPTDSRVLALDLSAEDAGARLATATADLEVGLLVYNAGADEQNTEFLAQPIGDLLAMVRRNCLTVLDACHHFGRLMVGRGRGGVVLVTSGAAWVGGGTLATYGATKAFDLLLAEALWAEWRDRGVHSLALVLGATDTPSLRKLMAKRGGAFPDLARPDAVVREALDHLGDGPTWSYGQDDPGGPSPFAALPRRQAVELMTEAAASVYRAPE